MEEIKTILDDCKMSMESTLDHLIKELANIRAGKASPTMLSSVMVDYYGNATPLNQVATVNTPDSRTLSVQPWEKSMIPHIEKAILEANLGLNPMNNGEAVIVNIPTLTQERRNELVKQAKNKAEEARISIRNTRHDSNKEIKNLDGSEDLKANAEIDTQELTDSYIKKIEDTLKEKEKEIVKV